MSAEADIDRLEAMAADLVRQQGAHIAPLGLSLAASFSKPDVHIGSLVARSKP